MRLENFGELPYNGDSARKFGNWTVRDIGDFDTDGTGNIYRSAYYYGTRMLILVRRRFATEWTVDEANIGWGSASEQKGVNRILRGAGITTHNYRRNGGVARYEIVSVETSGVA